MTTCAGCGSEIRWGRCSACNFLSLTWQMEQESMEDYRIPLPLTAEQQAAEDTLRGWFDTWEQERCDAEELRLFATGH